MSRRVALSARGRTGTAVPLLCSINRGVNGIQSPDRVGLQLKSALGPWKAEVETTFRAQKGLITR